jgi:hypothetical protein
MADVPVGAVPAPAVTVVPGKAPAVSTRAAKLAAVTAGLAKLSSEQPAPALEGKPAESAPVADPPAKTEPEAPAEPKIEEKPDEKPVETKPAEPDEAPDPKTAKALAQLDKQAKKFRDEQIAAKAELAQERAEIARIKAELTGQRSSVDELRSLWKSDPLAALDRLGVKSEDDYAVIGRAAFTQTKEGKADPRSKGAAEQTAKERALRAELEEAKSAIAELRDEFKTRDSKVQAQAFVEKYLDEAVKAIPPTPTLIGKLHAKSPAKARQALLELGARMEKRQATRHHRMPR